MASGFALVTPASRGIGFALARQLLAHTELPVCVTARKDCYHLHDKLIDSVGSQKDAGKRLSVFEVDVTGIYIYLQFYIHLLSNHATDSNTQMNLVYLHLLLSFANSSRIPHYVWH
jgi:NAD(P)-dependent dehydrogenase (short-subunit alcohol dehydrogenase family)